jgi:hypothetical protein
MKDSSVLNLACLSEQVNIKFVMRKCWPACCYNNFLKLHPFSICMRTHSVRWLRCSSWASSLLRWQHSFCDYEDSGRKEIMCLRTALLHSSFSLALTWFIVILQILGTSALVGCESSDSRPGRFTPGERVPGTHWIGSWVGLRAALDDG